MRNLLAVAATVAIIASSALFAHPAEAQTCTGTCVTSGTCADAGLVPGSGTCTSGICCIASTTTSTTITFTNPLSFTTVEGFLGAFLQALQAVIVTLAIVFIVIGGVLYIISGGDEGRMKTAKNAIFTAMIGLAVGVAAPTIIKEIYTILGSTPPPEVAGGETLLEILGRLLNFLLAIAGSLAIIMLVVGGITYFAAAGDEKKADTAKKIIKWSLIGIFVILGALVAVRQIANFF